MKMTIPFDNLAYSVFLSLDRGASFGSGFRLKYKDSNLLITANHVIFDESGKPRCKELIVTCHSPELKFVKPFIFSIEIEEAVAKGKIFVSHKNDTTAILIGTNKKLYDHKISLKTDSSILKRPTSIEFENYITIESEPSGRIVSVDKEATRNLDDIKIANDVYLMGYPTSLGMKQDFLFDPTKPLLRKGIIAGINIEKKTFIIDCPAYYGNSGGPIVEACEDGFFRVIGFVSKFIPFITEWKNSRERVINTDISNSGYSVCIPMDSIFELIDGYKN